MIPNIIADRYTLEEKVGEGSYSIVFRGYDRQERRKVAIKEMKYEHLPREEAQDAQRVFFNEINILKNLHHVNLPKVYDFFIFGGRHYMVMEWCEGRNLITIMEESRDEHLPQKETLNYLQQVCDALIYLQHNTRMIVYKDLKPSNIIVNDAGKIKLIDFGTARIYSPQKNKDTMVLGTPGYAPPEAYTGAQTDLSADVYSFGATFYHLLTGEEPFQFRFNFPDPRTYNSNLDDEISGILMDCLKSRDERIKDAFILRKRIYNVKHRRLQAGKPEYSRREEREDLVGIRKFFRQILPVGQLLPIILFLIGAGYILEILFSRILSIIRDGSAEDSNATLKIYLMGFLVILYIWQYSSVKVAIKWGIHAWSCAFPVSPEAGAEQGSLFNSLARYLNMGLLSFSMGILLTFVLVAVIGFANSNHFGKASFSSIIEFFNGVLPILLLFLIVSKVLIPLHSFIKWGFHAITDGEIANPAILVDKLQRRAHPGEKRIYSLLSDESKAIINNMDTSAIVPLMEIVPVIFDLNGMISGRDFYKWDSFRFHSLGREAKSLIMKGINKLDRFDTNRLNRLLLEGVFCESLKTSPLATSEGDFLLMKVAGGIIVAAILILGIFVSIFGS